jgi:hypothetical protein
MSAAVPPPAPQPVPQGPTPTEQTPEQELECLQRKLAKRLDEPGFAANAAEIQARIAELQAEA